MKQVMNYNKLMIIFQDRQSINGNVNETSNELQ